jgi:hypothetical protein
MAVLMAPERAAEFKQLLELSRILYFLPFEINKKIPLNLQISEQFCALYLDKNHAFINRRAESTYGSMDTGLKLAIVFCLWSEDSSCKFTLYR